jgi:RNA polymerase sigma-70 factor (ECF subfamily)
MAPMAIEDEQLERVERLCGSDETLTALLDTLVPEQRDAVRARILDDRSYDDIAGELRCSPAVVRKRVSRGLARIREQLREERA